MFHRPPTRRRISLILATLAPLVMLGASGAWLPGQSTTWLADPSLAGDWFEPANWSAGAPSSGSFASINNGGTATVGGATASAGELHLGAGPLEAGALSLAGGMLSLGNAFVGNSGVGTLTQTGGTLSASAISLGFSEGSRGTYVFSGGTTANQVFVGVGGDGTLIQNGGSLGGNVGVGGAATSAGTVLLNGGTLTASLFVGVGTVIQSDGVHVSDLRWSFGNHYRISGGILTAPNNITLGTFVFDPTLQTATVVQTGGTVSSGSFITVGSTGAAVYQLDDGTLNTVTLNVGSPFASGTFTQNGGTVSASGTLTVAQVGPYLLNGGLLSTGAVDIGFQVSNGGSFVQTGGRHVANDITLRNRARYVLGSGTLVVAHGISGAATFDFAGGAATLNYGGLTDLGSGTLSGAAAATVVGAPGSLLVVPAGFDPNTGFASFSTQGAVHHAGDTLTVAAGTGYQWLGTFNDHVELSGTLTSVAGRRLDLTRGIRVNGGTASLAPAGRVTIANAASGISAGALTAGALQVQNVFVHSGGSVSVGDLSVLPAGTYLLSGGRLSANVLGLAELGSGTFHHSGGTAAFGAVAAGPNSLYRWTGGALELAGPLSTSGTFDLTGAAVTWSPSSFVNFGGATLSGTQNATVTATSDSLLIFPPGFDPATQFASFSSQGIVHRSGTASLTIPAGRNFEGGGSISDFVELGGGLSGVNLLDGLRVLPGGSGRFGRVDVNDLASGMSGGSATVTGALTVGATGAARFVQSDGTLSYAHLGVGSASTASGTFLLQGGTLRAAATPFRADIGSAGAGTFVQSGGVHEFDPLGTGAFGAGLNIGSSSGSSGRYLISAGRLATGNVRVGINGAGTFQQTGGTTTAAAFSLGDGGAPGRGGTVELGGGTLTLLPNFASGGTLTIHRGSVTQTGGTFTGSGVQVNAGSSFVKTGGFAQLARVGNDGTFVHSGGTLSVGTFGNTGAGARAVLGGSLNWGNAGTFTNLSGVATFNADAGALGGKTLTLIASGNGTVALNTSQHLAGLRITTSQVKLAPGAGVINTGTLFLSTASTLDLTDNALVLDYPDDTPTPVQGLRNWIVQNRLTSSLADASHAIGLAEAADLFDAFPATFAGEAVDDTAVLVRYTRLGDADLDGDTDGADIATWAMNFTGSLAPGSGPKFWHQGDWDHDGDVDGADAASWAMHFSGSLAGGLGPVVELSSPLSPEAAATLRSLGVAVVPEPLAGATLLVAGIPALLRRRPR